MRYASVCDGIGAAHVAWQPLGWECAWTSEIEPFPAAVVDHHWKFKNLGDMTAITEEMLHDAGDVQLLVGGTPCQSFSVAGLRGGLADPRGNLALRFVQLVGVMRPEWVVWENVPGVLSSNGGRDFGTFLGALGELGYGFAYRVLDAQWFGVAQRRRRVFVVAHARDWRRAAAVLFERESVFGNPPTRGATGQVAPTIPARRTAGGGLGTDFDCDVGLIQDNAGSTGDGLARCVTTGEAKRQDWETCNFVSVQGGSQQDQVLTGEAVCPALCHSSNGHKGHNQPKVVVPYDIHGTLATKAASPTDVHTALRSRRPGESEASTTTVVAFAQNQREEVRELGDCATALNLQGTHQQTFLATPFTKSKRAQSVTDDETWVPGDVSPTMSCFDQGDTRATTVVAVDLQNVTAGGDVAGTLDTTRPSRGGGQAVAFKPSHYTRGKDGAPSEVAAPLSADADKGDQDTVVAFDTYNQTLNQTLRAGASEQAHEQVGAVFNGMAVRRLTPRECERLQGFPDDWTLVAYRGKPAADGPRYRALGNSMAVPVMAWIGRRIAQVEATHG